MGLFNYLQHTQRYLGDANAALFNIADLTVYVNNARDAIAAEGQCVRAIPTNSGGLATVTPLANGSGYTSPPAVKVSAPDAYGVGWTQAVVTANAPVGGQITGYTIVTPGTGYVGTPTFTLTGGGGTGAVPNPTLTGFLACNANQEVYTYATANQYLPTGASRIIAVQSIAVSWGSQKPVLRWIDWSGFQAYARSINLAATSWPALWAQYGQGTLGSIYVFPIPSQTLQMEWDCYCLPTPLVTDADVDLLPYPWTRAVPYYAAYLAFSSAKMRDDANYWENRYRMAIKEARSMVSPAMVPDFYQGL